ncbi:hypothetical protein ACFSTI_20490 [Rhizorhabdus histidinilytica]|uniref:Uncharacterized protein n=1 Tax=Rhizorhabdus histidinilytica TaxID=439228 RepID=A0A1T5BQC0_9SPHN|nr:hypothetical protein [Rhizorhabdus histidinilytica]SKB49406.1 hypothetical protein SAMN06295920_103199 [Rhizorhabdus histidinilytica]
MSALRPHIRVARAYEAAYVAEAERLHGQQRYEIALHMLAQASAHRRAAEMMEAEEAQSATDWPVQREGC